MNPCIVCNGKTNIFSEKTADGRICRKCRAYIPASVQLRYADAEYLKDLYKANKGKQKRFDCTAAYGNLFIDSLHGTFCISRTSKNGKPLEFGNIHSVTELTEIALYCTDVQNIGVKSNKIVCSVKMRMKTNETIEEYLICKNEPCSCKRSKTNIGMLEWNEPDRLVMFRNMFNQMIENVRYGLLKKLNDIQQAKKAINDYEYNKEWAKGILFLDDKDCSIETIKRHRNILIRQFHPDVSPEYGAEFAEKINKAFDIMSKK